MFTDLAVEGYQSLKSVQLKLGLFTVITGPTSSGKSSLIRAAQLLVFNARGTSYVRKGSAQATVALGNGDLGWAVSITRGARGKDAYRVSRLIAEPMQPSGWMAEPEVDTFTKLGGKVPEEVTALLALDGINFAGQFDRPYLLSESAGEVARALGQLTNVTMIFQAAREAGRRKAEITGNLKLARAELARVKSELPRFATLKSRLGALRRAEEAQIAHAKAEQRVTRLSALLGQHGAAQRHLDSIPAVPVFPDLGPLEARVKVINRLRGLISAHENWEHDADEASSYIEAMQAQALEASGKHAKLLQKAGRCPTCGQKVDAFTGLATALGRHGDHSGGDR